MLLLVLAARPAVAQTMTSQDVDALPASKPTLVEAYDPDQLQFGELRLPQGSGPFPVAVIIHGGCWTKGYATLRNTAPLASALTAHGIATWNIEYLQVGDPGGGWPGTFLDWGSAADHLRILAKSGPLDLTHVVAVGHSAGELAALWVATRGASCRREAAFAGATRFTSRPRWQVGDRAPNGGQPQRSIRSATPKPHPSRSRRSACPNISWRPRC
jgi:acetyl esterase/lipase